MIFREDRLYNVDKRRYHWRSILGVFIPAIAPELIDRQQQEMAALDQGGVRAVEVRSLTSRIARGLRGLAGRARNTQGNQLGKRGLRKTRAKDSSAINSGSMGHKDGESRDRIKSSEETKEKKASV